MTTSVLIDACPVAAPPARRGTLTVGQGAALTIGAVLGPGVITLPAIAVDIAGPASIVAWAALVALSIPLAATFAALGARIPDAGGVATYVGRAFGPKAAGAVGWCFYGAVPVGAPPASMMAGACVADVVGGGWATTVGVAAALIATSVTMNALGLRFSGRAQLGLAMGLALLMTTTVVVSIPHAQATNLAPFTPHGWGAVGAAAAVLVWAFAGWEAVAPLAGEYANPRRDVPRATAIAVTVVGVLYLALSLVTVLVLGPRAGTSAAPLSDLLATGIGEGARIVMAVAAVMLMLGAMNAYLAGGSRLGAALARDGALPSWLARGVHPGEVPRRSLAVLAVEASVALLVAGVLRIDLAPLILLATGCFTLVYAAGTAAALRLLARYSRSWWLALIAFVSTLALLVVNGAYVLWALAVVAASLAYQLRCRHARRPAWAARTPRPHG